VCFHISGRYWHFKAGTIYGKGSLLVKAAQELIFESVMSFETSLNFDGSLCAQPVAGTQALQAVNLSQSQEIGLS